MEKIDILLWIIGSGFGLLFALLLVIWNSINQRIDNTDKSLGNRIENSEKHLTNRIDKLDEKITDVDRRLCRLEGAFASKDCCMIKDDRQLRKAE